MRTPPAPEWPSHQVLARLPGVLPTRSKEGNEKQAVVKVDLDDLDRLARRIPTAG